MYLNTSTPLDAALREGYQGKAVELASTYAHRSTLVKMRADIARRTKIISGPLYLGEAEQLLLFPLAEAVRRAVEDDGKGQAMVARHAYQLAADYALIFDISKISQSKDIANQLTLNSLQAQPIVKAFAAKTSITSNTGEYKKDISQIWLSITEMMKAIVYQPSNNKTANGTPYTTALSMLYEATSAQPTEAELTSSTVNAWNQLLGYLRHGKGTPLDKPGRRNYMSIMSELLNRIDMLISEAESADLKGDADQKKGVASTAFIDAYTAMYWLNIYLEAVSQYDVIFPATDLMVQSQAWVLVIKTQAAKFKKLFVDVAQVAAAYDVFTAIRLWNEVRQFYSPVINNALATVSDMDALWGECQARATKMLSQYAASQVDSMFTAFKSYMQADYLLPEQDFAMVTEVGEKFTMPIPTGDQYLAKSGADVLLEMEAIGEHPISVMDRELLIPALAYKASAVEAALAYLKRSREILNLSEETDDIYHALLPDGLKWNDPYSLKGTIRDLNPATFQFVDPMQLCYEKYTVTPTGSGIASLDWKFTPLLMKPFYRVPQLQEFSQQRSSSSRILWEGIGELPVGDMITAQYVAQPLPACYTASRNANFVNNDFSAYLTLMSGRSGVTAASRHMFRKLAAVLDTYENTYAQGILDALAATMFVYRTNDKGAWSIMEPSLPTIYGMPRAAMMQANKVELTSATSDLILKRSLRVTIDSGKTYAFVLHDKMPRPEELTYVAYPYAKGVYIQIPLLKSVFVANEDEIERILHISFSKNNNTPIDSMGAAGASIVELCQTIGTWDGKEKLGGAKFIQTCGWAPYLVNLPHMLFSYQDEEQVALMAKYKASAMLSVRVRYDAVERAIYVCGFVENPVEILAVDDYQKAINEVDPSPLPQEGTKEVEEITPDVNEPKRSEAEPTPDPATLGAKNKVSGNETGLVSTVTKAPVVVPDPNGSGAEIQIPAPMGDEGPDKKVKIDKNAGPVTGDPTGEKAVDDDEDATDKEKYWKKVSESGDVLDVVKAIACPSGYVPASEDEYRTYVVKKSQAEEGISKEDK